MPSAGWWRSQGAVLAQELGTAGPESPKRLDEALAKLRATGQVSRAARGVATSRVLDTIYRRGSALVGARNIVNNLGAHTPTDWNVKA